MAAAAARAKIPLFAALPRHTGDNAAMIAFAAWADPQGTVVLDGSGSAMDSLDPSARLA
jgi:N6-L-threonylcarbamoyladenine synthase